LSSEHPGVYEISGDRHPMDVGHLRIRPDKPGFLGEVGFVLMQPLLLSG
jgi:hypothetical protein